MSVTTANWMSTPQIQGLTLQQLVLPGTHDSGSFSLQLALSQSIYPDIAFLWTLNPGTATPNGQNPFASGSLYIGQPAYDLVMQVAYNVARSQDQTIAQQLAQGIRYFDLRVYYDTTQQPAFYIDHGLKGCLLSDALADLAAFLNTTTPAPAPTELVVLCISHVNYNNANGAVPIPALVTLLTSALGANNIFQVPNPNAPDPFQAIASYTVGQITNGANRVIIINGDADNPTYNSPYIFESAGYAAFPNEDTGYDTVDNLTTQAVAQAPENPGQLSRLAWCLTCQATDAATEAANELGGDGGVPGTLPILQTLAQQANAALPGFLANNPNINNQVNCITVDWFEQGSAQDVVTLALAMNAQRSSG